DAAHQALNQQTHFVQLNDRDIGGGIEVPHLEHRPGESVGSGAYARDADPFAFEIRGRFDLRIHDETVEWFVEDRPHEESIRAAQIRTDAGVGDRLGYRNFARE